MKRVIPVNPPLRRALTARNRAIVNLFIDSSIRLNKLVGLHLGDIDKSSRVILVHCKGNYAWSMICDYWSYPVW